MNHKPMVTISLSAAMEALEAMEKIAGDENSYPYRRMLDARNLFFSAKRELRGVVDAERASRKKLNRAVRLRRASDNAERVFQGGEEDKLDITAVKNWAGGSEIHVVALYQDSDVIMTESVLANQPQLAV